MDDLTKKVQPQQADAICSVALMACAAGRNRDRLVRDVMRRFIRAHREAFGDAETAREIHCEMTTDYAAVRRLMQKDVG